VVFLETEPEFQPVLERWLDEVGKGTQNRVG
jgi:hypothetical protein